MDESVENVLKALEERLDSLDELVDSIIERLKDYESSN